MTEFVTKNDELWGSIWDAKYEEDILWEGDSWDEQIKRSIYLPGNGKIEFDEGVVRTDHYWSCEYDEEKDFKECVEKLPKDLVSRASDLEKGIRELLFDSVIPMQKRGDFTDEEWQTISEDIAKGAVSAKVNFDLPDLAFLYVELDKNMLWGVDASKVAKLVNIANEGM